jgi:hypothetical protein
MKEQCREIRKGSDPTTVAQDTFADRHADGRQALRTRVVELSIRAIWGESVFPVTLAAGIPDQHRLYG